MSVLVSTGAVNVSVALGKTTWTSFHYSLEQLPYSFIHTVSFPVPAVLLACSQLVSLCLWRDLALPVWNCCPRPHRKFLKSRAPVTERRGEDYTPQFLFYGIHDLLSVCSVWSFVSLTNHNTYNPIIQTCSLKPTALCLCFCRVERFFAYSFSLVVWLWHIFKVSSIS